MNIKFKHVVVADILAIFILWTYGHWTTSVYVWVFGFFVIVSTIGFLLEPTASAIADVVAKYKQQKGYIVYDIMTDIIYLYLMFRASLAALFIIYTANLCVKYWIYTVNWRKI